MKKPHKPKVTGKGNEGKKGSGAKTRKAIGSAKKKGATTAQIAKAGNRSPSTINNIASGNIKNPPSDLAAKISKAKGKKKK